jgi:hypothetical protein
VYFVICTSIPLHTYIDDILGLQETCHRKVTGYVEGVNIAISCHPDDTLVVREIGHYGNHVYPAERQLNMSPWKHEQTTTTDLDTILSIRNTTYRCVDMTYVFVHPCDVVTTGTVTTRQVSVDMRSTSSRSKIHEINSDMKLICTVLGNC